MQSYHPPAPFAPSLHCAWSSRLKSLSRRGVSPCFVYPHHSWRPHPPLDRHHCSHSTSTHASATLLSTPYTLYFYTDPEPSEISLIFFTVWWAHFCLFAPRSRTLAAGTPRSHRGVHSYFGLPVHPDTRQECSLVATPPLFSFFLSLDTLANKLWPLLPSRMLPFLNPPSASAAAVVTRATSTCLHPRLRAVKPAQWCAQLCCCHVKPNLKTPCH